MIECLNLIDLVNFLYLLPDYMYKITDNPPGVLISTENNGIIMWVWNSTTDMYCYE